MHQNNEIDNINMISLMHCYRFKASAISLLKNTGISFWSEVWNLRETTIVSRIIFHITTLHMHACRHTHMYTQTHMDAHKHPCTHAHKHAHTSHKIHSRCHLTAPISEDYLGYISLYLTLILSILLFWCIN